MTERYAALSEKIEELKKDGHEIINIETVYE
jgi:hypothetical protein